MAVSPADEQADRPFVIALRSGDLDTVARRVATDPAAAGRLLAVRGSRSRSPLHVVADWPGYYPRAAEMVALLLSAGADPEGGAAARGAETPLHWAASTDDVEVAAALLDGGADLEAVGASIAGGPPLDNAVGYGCWAVARLLVERGAVVDRLWHASALGLRQRVADLLGAVPPPSAEEIDEAFWQACHGGQRRTAEQLLAAGADPRHRPSYADESSVAAARSGGTARSLLADWLAAIGVVDEA